MGGIEDRGQARLPKELLDAVPWQELGVGESPFVRVLSQIRWPFSGGIGEHDVQLRADVARQLAWLGVRIDPAANAAASPAAALAEAVAGVLKKSGAI